MTTFAIVTSVISLLLYSGFLALSVWRFGWQGSYSGYAAKWSEFLYNERDLGPWSLVTLFTAILLVPAMAEAGDESPLQFLGFASPVYLGVVAFTPKWETVSRQRKIHCAGTAVCAVCAVLWLIFALRLWFYIPIAFVLCSLAAYFTKTIKKSYVLWLELTLFAAVYGAVLIGG